MKTIHLILILLCIELYAQDELTLLTAIHGEKEGDAFSSVDAIGDVDGDGYDDFIVGGSPDKYSQTKRMLNK
jgi:hypothetical protein